VSLRAALLMIAATIVAVGVLLGVMFGPAIGLIGAACAIVIAAVSSLAVVVPKLGSRAGRPRDEP